jgi:hypothetical protein
LGQNLENFKEGYSLKSRKLFAILTLVAFMMTLVPTFAFASSVAAVTGTVVAGTQAPTITFTATNGIAVGGNINITFPAGITVTAVTPGEVTVNGTAASATAVSGQVLTITNAAAVSTGAATTVVIGDGGAKKLAGFGTVAGTTYQVSVATTADSDAVNGNITVVAATANRFNAVLSVDKTTVDADNSEQAEFTVYVYDQYNNPKSGANVYFASDRAGTDTFSTGTDTANNVKYITTDSNGKATVKVKSQVAGTAKIGFALADDGGSGTKDVYNYLIGTQNVTAADVQLIGVKEVTFAADAATKLAVHEVKLKDRANDRSFVIPYTNGGTTYGKSGDTYIPAQYGTSAVAPSGDTWGKANDLDYFEIAIKVTNSSNAPVPNEEVTFSVNKSSARLSATKVNTDGAGIAKVKVYANKPDTYTVTATAASKTQDVKVKFDPADVTKIEYVQAQDRVIAKGDTPSFKFALYDTNGNKIQPPSVGTTYAAVPSKYTIEVVTEPSDSDLSVSDFQAQRTTDDLLQVKAPALQKEGSYKFRVSLDNGSYAEVQLTVKKQGTITALKFSYPQTVLALGAKSSKPDVYRVDAAGVELEIDDTNFNGNSITFSASDYTKISNVGINAATGEFTATTDKDYIGDVTITALDSANKLSASFTIKITAKMASIVAVAPAEKTEVGKTATVTLKAIDVNGTQVAVGEAPAGAVNTTVELSDYYVTEKPAGAAVSIDESKKFEDELQEKGATTVAITSNAAGKVTATLIVKVYDNSYSVPVTVEFGAAKQVIGAKKVTMFIGATGYMKDDAAAVTDVAPFIKDGRTFVAIRPVADAFGAQIGWNEATRTVTLTRPDIAVTIVIDSSNITVVKDGVTSTVVADVPAFIKDGRTVLPFRAVGEAFGAQVNWDAATQSVTYVQ